MAEASNHTTVSMSNPTIPMFKGDNYEFWSIKMRTMLKSHGLWELADKAIPTPDLAPIDTARRDAKALFFIQQAVHESVFAKIAAAETANEAWTTLKTAFQGSSKVVAIKLQGLRREFETLFMNQGESVQVFLTRVTSIVNQIRSCGENLSENTVVMKVLRSLTTKFDHVVAAIEESKDMSTYTLDELMGSLQVHETRLNRSEERDDTKAFYAKGDSSRSQQQGQGSGKGICKPIATRRREKKVKAWSAITATSSVMCRPTATRRKEKKNRPVLLKKRAMKHDCSWPKLVKMMQIRPVPCLIRSAWVLIQLA